MRGVGGTVNPTAAPPPHPSLLPPSPEGAVGQSLAVAGGGRACSSSRVKERRGMSPPWRRRGAAAGHHGTAALRRSAAAVLWIGRCVEDGVADGEAWRRKSRWPEAAAWPELVLSLQRWSRCIHFLREGAGLGREEEAVPFHSLGE
jgi:hypothetical protein